MKVLDKELEKAIGYKVGKFSGEELSDKDFKSVEELSISNRSFSGELKNIDLNGLKYLSNVKSLSLQYFLLDDSIINLLNSLKKLSTLQLVSCEYKSRQKLEIDSLHNLILDCCSIPNYSVINVPEIIQIIGEGKLRLDELLNKEKVRQMFLQKSKIKGFNKIDEFTNLQRLNLEESQIDSKVKLEELKERINVVEKDDYLPMR